jgi:hypothetical protein
VDRGAAVRLNARSQWWLSVGKAQPQASRHVIHLQANPLRRRLLRGARRICPQDDGLPSRRPPRVRRPRPPTSGRSVVGAVTLERRGDTVVVAVAQECTRTNPARDRKGA